MRLFFLLRIFLVVNIPGRVTAEEQGCTLPSEQVGSFAYAKLNEKFIERMSNCTEWNGKYHDVIEVDKGVTQDMFQRAFANVKRMTKVAGISISKNKFLTSAVFPKLESVEPLATLEISNCPQLKSVSFPSLVMKDLPTEVTITGTTLGSGNEEVLRNQLADCAFPIPISNVSLLSKCTTATVSRLEFAKGAMGKVEKKIGEIKGYLRIVDTNLHDLNFLQLKTYGGGPQSSETCVITGNRLCEYDEQMVKATVLAYNPSCTIENNEGGHCGGNAGVGSKHMTGLFLAVVVAYGMTT